MLCQRDSMGATFSQVFFTQQYFYIRYKKFTEINFSSSRRLPLPSSHFALHIGMMMPTSSLWQPSEMHQKIAFVHYFTAAIRVIDPPPHRNGSVKSQAFMRVLADRLIHSFWG